VLLQAARHNVSPPSAVLHKAGGAVARRLHAWHSSCRRGSHGALEVRRCAAGPCAWGSLTAPVCRAAPWGAALVENARQCGASAAALGQRLVYTRLTAPRFCGGDQPGSPCHTLLNSLVLPSSRATLCMQSARWPLEAPCVIAAGAAAGAPVRLVHAVGGDGAHGRDGGLPGRLLRGGAPAAGVRPRRRAATAVTWMPAQHARARRAQRRASAAEGGRGAGTTSTSS